MHNKSQQVDHAALLQLNSSKSRRQSFWIFWSICQYRAIKRAYNEIIATPVSTLLTVGVIAIAFTLPLILFVLLQNLQGMAEKWHGTPQILLYLKKEITDAQRQTLQSQLISNKQINYVSYISPQAGMQTLEQDESAKQASQLLNDNPLPGVFIISPSQKYASPEDMQKLYMQLSQNNLAASAQLNLTWVKRLYYLTQSLKKLVISIAILFGGALLLIIGNTIRLEMHRHAHEIYVLRLMGASKSFIRRPLLYQAVTYSLLGCGLAYTISTFVLNGLSAPLEKLAMTYQTQWSLHNLPMSQLFGLLIIASMLSYISAYLISSHFLASKNH